MRSNSKVRVWRAGNQVTEASLSEVRLGREAVGEVAQGGECGLHLLGEPLLEVGDILEVYHEEVHARVIT